MRALCASLMLICAAASTMQAAEGSTTRIREMLAGRRAAARAATAAKKRGPVDAKLAYQLSRHRATLVTSADVVLPFVLNAEGIVTRIRLVNMENQPAEFEMFFVADDGFEGEIDIRGEGTVSSLKRTIAVGGSVTIDTTGRGDDQLVWAFFDAGRNKIGATATIEVFEEQGTYAASYSAQFLGDTRVRGAFDNTGGSDTEIGIINVSLDPAEVGVTLRGQDGSSMLSTNLTLEALEAIGFVPAEETRRAQNVRGTVELAVPSNSRGGLAVVIVQFFESGFLAINPGFATVN